MADINLLIVVFLWGVNIPIMKFALSRMDRFSFNALRLTLSAIALGVIVGWMKAPIINRAKNARPIWRQFINLVLFAILTAFGYQLLFLVGMDSTSAGNTGLIMSSIPMWTAILALIFLKERLSAAAWIGLSVAVIGVLIVTLSKPHTGAIEGSLIGNLLISAAALCWAVGSVISMPIMRNISPIALTFYSIAFTLPLHFSVAPGWFGELTKLPQDPMLLAALIYSGVFSTGVASAMWNLGVKQLGPSHAAGFQNLVPIIALGSSWVLIGEVPYALQVAGGALIISGLIVIRWSRRRKPLPKTEPG